MLTRHGKSYIMCKPISGHDTLTLSPPHPFSLHPITPSPHHPITVQQHTGVPSSLRSPGDPLASDKKKLETTTTLCVVIVFFISLNLKKY
jgi:hypothetical protein